MNVYLCSDHYSQWPFSIFIFNVSFKLPAIGGHLPNADADSHLLVVRTCYNGQCKEIPRFRWSFQPKIAGAHPNLRSTVRSNFGAVVWWPQSIFHIGACVMNHVIAASETLPLVTFVLWHHVENVTVKGPSCHVPIHRISKKYIMYGILVHHDINSLYINVGVLIGVYISIWSHI